MAEEPDLLDEEDAAAPATPTASNTLAEKLAAIKLRCDAAKIEFTYVESEAETPYATILLQSGRSKRKLVVYGEARADELLAIQFEEYRFISGYEAICSYKDGLIEAGLRAPQTPSSFVFERILRQLAGGNAEAKSIELTPPLSLPGRPTIKLGPSSPELIALCRSRASRVSIKLEGSKTKQHDQALAELRSYSDSLFFEIDTIFGTTFILERERRNRILPSLRRQAEIELAYPSAHYNEEAISLYWYAKSARDMPLLRFLAFYQSIEFYFPRYSRSEARRRVSSILKQPTFRPHRDDDVDRLISAIQTSRGGGLGSEQSQLRAVVNECISADDMRRYLTAAKEREEHFSGKAPKYHKVPLANKNADLRNDVADRIYDIRCKIVHTKNEYADDNHPMIMPFSEDADYLLHDIDLAEFVARSVLVYSSDELG